jgi:creatinine amidohydrolase
MTDFFPYADLTWPEVAGLPRSTPLILPLGGGYPLEQLFEALGGPPRLGLLPSIPFGWPGSGLSIPEREFRACVENLLDSLRDDGFTQVYALTPRGVDLGLGAARVSLPPATEAPTPLLSDADRRKVVLIPIGHTEQHGYHLPLGVDTIIIDAIAKGVAAAAPDQAVTLPVMPYGVSTHRATFAGTLNAGGRAFEDFWVSAIDVLVEWGCERFYFLSGHGGNMSFLVNVVKYAGERHPQVFCATSFLYLSGPQGIEALERHRRSGIGGMGHACELETSLMLALRPDLVHLDRAVDEINFITTPSYYMDWIEGGALIANPPWSDDTATGAYGAGSLATAEHGQIWLQAAIAEKIAHVGEIHTQQARRQERRRTTANK